MVGAPLPTQSDPRRIVALQTRNDSREGTGFSHRKRPKRLERECGLRFTSSSRPPEPGGAVSARKEQSGDQLGGARKEWMHQHRRTRTLPGSRITSELRALRGSTVTLEVVHTVESSQIEVGNPDLSGGVNARVWYPAGWRRARAGSTAHLVLGQH